MASALKDTERRALTYWPDRAVSHQDARFRGPEQRTQAQELADQMWSDGSLALSELQPLSLNTAMPFPAPMLATGPRCLIASLEPLLRGFVCRASAGEPGDSASGIEGPLIGNLEVHGPTLSCYGQYVPGWCAKSADGSTLTRVSQSPTLTLLYIQAPNASGRGDPSPGRTGRHCISTVRSSVLSPKFLARAVGGWASRPLLPPVGGSWADRRDGGPCSPVCGALWWSVCVLSPLLCVGLASGPPRETPNKTSETPKIGAAINS